MAEASRLILTTQDCWSIPLMFVSDIFQMEEAFTVRHYTHTHPNSKTGVMKICYCYGTKFCNLAWINWVIQVCLRVIKIKLMSPVSVSSGLILSKKISVIKINGATLQIIVKHGMEYLWHVHINMDRCAHLLLFKTF